MFQYQRIITITLFSTYKGVNKEDIDIRLDKDLDYLIPNNKLYSI